MLIFYKRSESFLLQLADDIESNDSDSIFDVEYSDGILTILVHATDQEYVINRHSAHKKIWYSSPLSGADYFSFDEEAGQWRSEKGVELGEKLLSELAGFKNTK